MTELVQHLLELIRKTSTDLPHDVEQGLLKAREKEENGSTAEHILGQILENVRLARASSIPICQDTGTLNFFVRHPAAVSRRELSETIREAIRLATSRNYLRPNAVDSVTGLNSGNNLGGAHFPSIHFEEIQGDTLQFDLLLKGGGCENVGRQYALPDTRIGAGRDLDGVRKAALDAVMQAQGRGCAPGFLGIAIGGDRAVSYQAAKEVFLLDMDGHHPDPQIAALETRITTEANQLGIGPMGLGGHSTILRTRIVALHRLPASYFVTIAYMCWAYRKGSLRVSGGKAEYC